jgi:hypothetical protein
VTSSVRVGDAAAIVRVGDADHCVATWHGVFIVIWRSETSASAVANMIRLLRAFMAAQRDPITLVMIIESASRVPNARARSEFAMMSRDLVPKMNVAVIVPEGGGFRVATVRGVAIALTALLPHKVPFKFVDTVGQAAAAIAPHLRAATGGATAFARAVAAMRAGLESPGEEGGGR